MHPQEFICKQETPVCYCCSILIIAGVAVIRMEQMPCKERIAIVRMELMGDCRVINCILGWYDIDMLHRRVAIIRVELMGDWQAISLKLRWKDSHTVCSGDCSGISRVC